MELIRKLTVLKQLPSQTERQNKILFMVWLRWSLFSLSSPHSAVVCTGTMKDVDNTPVLWLLLGSAGTASALSLNILHPSKGLKVDKILAGDSTRPADTDLPKGYSIQYDVSSDIKPNGMRRNGVGCINYFQCLPSAATLHVLKPCIPGSG